MSESKRVLLVEDNQTSAGDYLRWLRQAGYQAEHAAARAEAIDKARAFSPDVVLLDLQIPSAHGRADEHVDQGLAALADLVADDPFRPVVVITAHSNDRELMRRVMQQNHGGRFVFKDARDLERAMLEDVAIALASPAYLMSRTVKRFRGLVEQNLEEEAYRPFIAEHWRELLGPEYQDCRSPYEIARGAKIDILAVRHDGFPDLWELKRPGDKLFSDYNQWKHHSNDCARAIGQLMEYCDLAEKEPRLARGYDARRGVDMTLNRPRGFVVIGRYDEDPRQQQEERDRLRLENRFLAGLTIMTYDDLVERAERFVDFLARYRNGAGETSGT